MFFPLCFFFFFNNGPSNVHKLSYLKGGGVGQKLPILLSKKMTNRGGGGQKSPILRRHSLWMAPNTILEKCMRNVREALLRFIW